MLPTSGFDLFLTMETLITLTNNLMKTIENWNAADISLVLVFV